MMWNWLTADGSKKTKHFIGIDWTKWKDENDDDGDEENNFDNYCDDDSSNNDNDDDNSFSFNKCQNPCGDNDDDEIYHDCDIWKLRKIMKQEMQIWV